MQFKSKADRDKAINTEIRSVKDNLARKQSLHKDMSSKIQTLETQIANVESEFRELRARLDGRKEAIEQLNAETREADETRAKLDDERRYPSPNSNRA